jgi:hypothetical protein
MPLNNTTFYVYTLARPDDRIFYVGKGKGRRVFTHDAEARGGHRCHKCNIIRKIWKHGGQVKRYIVFTTNNEAEAFAYECELIASFKPGTLANQTEGGQGMSNPSAEVRAKLSASRKATWSDPEYRGLARNREVFSDPELLARRNASIKVAHTTPEARARASDASKRGKSIPGYRERQSAAAKASQASPEYRARMSEALKASWAQRKAQKTE